MQVQPFTELTGPTTAIPCLISEVFQLFLSMGILQLIVDQTNLYASQVMAPEKFAAWEQVTVPELKAYFGFMILMGINKLPALVDYWKVDPIFHYAPVAGRIARDSFFVISRYLHFADNTQLLPNTDPAHDKFGKVRPIIDHLKVSVTIVSHAFARRAWVSGHETRVDDACILHILSRLS